MTNILNVIFYILVTGIFIGFPAMIIVGIISIRDKNLYDKRWSNAMFYIFISLVLMLWMLIPVSFLIKSYE